MEYEGTRHNIGGAIVSELADRLGVKLKPDPRMRARFAETSTSGSRVLLAVPMTYMNESGAAVVPLLRRAGFEDLGRLLIVHDELDLAPGRLQLKVGGGLAGQQRPAIHQRRAREQRLRPAPSRHRQAPVEGPWR